MISWIQKTFQRHIKVIFAVMLLLMALPLIWVFNPSSGTRTDDRRSVARYVFGYNLASQNDQARLFGDATFSAQLQSGYAPDEASVQNYAYQRAATLELADRLKIPPTSNDEIADFIKTLRAFAGPNGEFDPQRYASFRDSLKASARFTETDIRRVIADDVRADKVEKLISGPGYVLPSDVRFQLEQADAAWTLGVATVDYDSYHPDIPVTDAILVKFYAENSFRYEIPPRVEASCVDFPAAALAPTISVTAADVRAYYDANLEQFPPPAANPKVSVKADPAADFAVVRPQVEAAVKLQRARTLALKHAADFSYAIYEQHLTPGTPAFAAFLADRHLALQPLAPFTHEAGPAELGGSSAVADAAFQLGRDHTYSDAIGLPTGAVVLFWKDVLPTRTPLLAEIRAKVATDYVENERRKRFVELGRTLRATIESRLKSGDAFEQAVAVAATAGGVKIEAKMLAPFTRRNPPQNVDYSVFGALDRLDKGRVSDMTIAKDHGYLVYAADKRSPDLSPANPLYVTMHNQLALGDARLTMGSYLNEVVSTELKKAEPAVQ